MREAGWVVAAVAALVVVAASAEVAEVELYRDKASEFAVCRISDACMGRDGQVLLHEKLRKYQDVLRQCDRDVFESVKFWNVPEAEKLGATVDYDVFGYHMRRTHFPHFLTDFIEDMRAFDLVLGSRGRESASRTCYSRGEETTCKELNIDPAIIMEDGLQKPNLPKWIPKFVRLFSNDDVHTTMLEKSAVWTQEAQNTTCFQSLFLYPKTERPLQSVLRRHYAFENSGIEKGRKLQDFTDRCRVNVTVLNREGEPPGEEPQPIVRRTIANHDELEQRLLDMTNSMSDFADVDVQTVYFEKKSFEEQISIMQNTDILVAVHGAGLTNLIFLREGSQIIELTPFSYYPALFGAFARDHVGIPLARLSAEPDLESYTSCIHKWVKPGADDYTKAIESIDVFQAEGEQWMKKHQQDPTTMPQFRTDLSKYSFHRVCGRQQKLRVNANAVVKLVAQHILTTCQLSPDDIRPISIAS